MIGFGEPRVTLEKLRIGERLLCIFNLWDFFLLTCRKTGLENVLKIQITIAYEETIRLRSLE